MKLLRAAIIVSIIVLIGISAVTGREQKPMMNTSGNPTPAIMPSIKSNDINSKLDILIEKASSLEKRIDADREFIAGTNNLLESKLSSKQ